MPGPIERVLASLKLHPVLVDVGASGEPPPFWRAIAPYSVYVGFDPDQRDFKELPHSAFHKRFLVNEAVTTDAAQQTIKFYLTFSPYCSSTLPPDADALKNYLFSDLFAVEAETVAPASTLDAILDRVGVDRVDWLKVDSQGTDLRLFNSLTSEVRTRVLALDVEPGLIDVYQGEDLFVETHRALTQDGFWLSRLDVKGAVRMRRDSVQQLTTRHPDLNPALFERTVRASPSWCEARYLRTLEWAEQHHFTREAYGLLWVFAMLDQQYGFALDLTLQYERHFQRDTLSLAMEEGALAQIRRVQTRALPLSVARKLLPTRVKHNLKQMISALRPS